MLKLLFIEDQKESIEPVLDLIKEQKDMHPEFSEFEDAEEKLTLTVPTL